MRKSIVAAPVALTLVLAAPLARAQSQPLWELGLGAGVLRLPHYRGSDQSHTWVLPVPYVVYRGEILKADREGARAVLLETDRLDFDLSLAASPPTRSDDNEARRGMEDLPPIVEFGPNVNWTLGRGQGWKLDLRLPVRAALGVGSNGGFKGWVATPQLNLDLTDLRGWRVGVAAAAIAQDRRYNELFYGVSPAEAAPGRPAYRPGGGAAGGYLLGAVSRRVDNWWLGGFLRWDSLRGASFLDSPLVRQREHWSVGVAVSWVFATSDRQVDED
ncbi:MipA/OmpV family protein [Azohydromonas caseinilytica]|uniref:MipA/OmpV family protein n=1 Tax=Azohydromonas caseinilytica TaxID=2728836 RepID=A0A848FGS6_9BURK|nr:MipA/OmpV family protein [Azohydromonas caseinilytica]NML18544.1 MipA/OmpV family protein [Azohydromonas caseinilytica]